MPKFTVKAGKHYHVWPPISTLPWIGSQSMIRIVTFNETASYDSPAYNSQDVSKLFGLDFGLGGVHHNSARFGWRWSASDKCIELLAYIYYEGKRNQDEQLRFPVVAQVQLGERVRCEIEYDGVDYTFSVTSEEPGRVGGFIGCWGVSGNAPLHLPHYGFTHGLYFGGSLPAPHDITVQIDRP